MLSKASDDVASKLFTDCLDVELKALVNLTIMAGELVVDKWIEVFEQLAVWQAHTNYLTRLAAYSSDAEIVIALLIDLAVWGANCGKMSSIFKKHYDFPDNSCWTNSSRHDDVIDIESKAEDTITVRSYVQISRHRMRPYNR